MDSPWKRWKAGCAMGEGKTVRADLHRKPSSWIREAALQDHQSGVLENKGVQPAVPGSHRFGVTLIEVPVGQGANLHSHKTEEVFFPLNGKMLIIWGPEGEHELMLNQWDCISVPVGVMRGFRNPNDHDLVVYSVVGGRDEEVGRIDWHPDVVKAGEATGLAYDDKGFIQETAAK